PSPRHGRRARDRATERVEGRRAGFPPARRVGLVANPRSEMARQDGDDEEGPKREVVLRISHPQRMEWLREEEIVDQDAQDRGEDRWVEPPPPRTQQDRRQEEHAGVPQWQDR